MSSENNSLENTPICISKNILIVVINGQGECGKDYLIEGLNIPDTTIYNISSITPAKDILKQYGWDGKTKDLKTRAVLHELKYILDTYNDCSLRYLIDLYNDIAIDHDNTSPVIIFVHISEIYNIQRFKEIMKPSCKVTTVFVEATDQDEYNDPRFGFHDKENEEIKNDVYQRDKYDHKFLNTKSGKSDIEAFSKFIKIIYSSIMKEEKDKKAVVLTNYRGFKEYTTKNYEFDKLPPKKINILPEYDIIWREFNITVKKLERDNSHIEAEFIKDHINDLYIRYLLYRIKDFLESDTDILIIPYNQDNINPECILSSINNSFPTSFDTTLLQVISEASKTNRRYCGRDLNVDYFFTIYAVDWFRIKNLSYKDLDEEIIYTLCGLLNK